MESSDWILNNISDLIIIFFNAERDEERDWKLLELLNWAIKFSRPECLSFCEIVTNFRDFSLFWEAKSSLQDYEYIDHLQKVSLLMKSRNFSSRRAEKADKSESDQASLQCAPRSTFERTHCTTLSLGKSVREFSTFSLSKFSADTTSPLWKSENVHVQFQCELRSSQKWFKVVVQVETVWFFDR